MFRQLISKLICGLLLAILSNASNSANDTISRLITNDPMQPPVYALNKARLAKLKNSTIGSQTKSTSQKPVKKSWQLSSILIGEHRKVAIINNKTLILGEKIDGAKLVRISSDRVQLVKKGKRIELKLVDHSNMINKKAVGKKL